MAAEPQPYWELDPSSIAQDLCELADQWPDRSDPRKDILYLGATALSSEGKLDEDHVDAMLNVAKQIEDRNHKDAEALLKIVDRGTALNNERLH